MKIGSKAPTPIIFYIENPRYYILKMQWLKHKPSKQKKKKITFRIIGVENSPVLCLERINE